MKTLKIRLYATMTTELQYDCFVEAPDDADPEGVIHLLQNTVDGGEFYKDDGGFTGGWHHEDGEWELADEGVRQDDPRWRYIDGDEPAIEEVGFKRTLGNGEDFCDEDEDEDDFLLTLKAM